MTVPNLPFNLSAAFAEDQIALPAAASSLAALAGGGPPFACSSLAGKSNSPTASCANVQGSSFTQGGGTVSATAIASATGGAGGYTFAFSYVSGVNWTVNQNGASATFSHIYAKLGSGDQTGTYQVVATDSSGRASAPVQFTVELEWQGSNA